jgi:AraC family transcriptional regulator of adaptative response/methylated-DNA-[protein]-cysteine methyltransferase
MVADLCRLLEAAETPPTLDELARHAKLSPYHLHRVFKALTGLTPKAYAAAHRGKRMRAGLEAGGTVTEALYDAGYGSGGRFYAEADKVLGMTPTRFRAGGAGAEIRFAVGQCALGAILVACSERGVCAIELGDDPEVLARRLQDRFPHATWVGGDARFERWVAAVVGFVEAPRIGLRCRSTCAAPRSSSASGRPCRSDPAGTDRELRRDRRAPRGADRRARSGPGLRRKSAGGRDPMPSRGPQRRCAVGLSVGASSASARCWPARQSNERSRRRALSRRPPMSSTAVAAVDWTALGADLDAQGAAVIERLADHRKSAAGSRPSIRRTAFSAAP